MRKTKKLIFPIYSKCALISAGVAVMLSVVIDILKSQNIYLLLLNISSDEMLPLLIVLTAVLVISGSAVFAYKNSKHKALITVGIVLLSLVYFFFNADYRYFEFYSNDNAHRIIIKEQSFLLAGYGEIYEMTEPGIMSHIGDYTTDDGYKPFSSKNYSFDWDKDGFTLKYYFGAGSSSYFDGYKSEHFEYIKNDK